MKTDVIVIGGGVIGVSAAYYLARQGIDVTLIEQGDIAAGSSWGNAGLICPNHSEPIPGPGVLGQGLKWLLDAESPFYIKPRLDPALIRWLWRFRNYCNEDALNRAVPLLRDMQRASLQLYHAILDDEKIDCDFETSGGILAFRTQTGFEQGVHHAESMQRHGLRSKIITSDAVHSLEPALHPAIVGAVQHLEDAFISPHSFVFGLADAARKHGAALLTDTKLLGFATSNGKITAVWTNKGDFQPQQVVLAAGAWSTDLVRKLGLHLPMQPAKGYSITISQPQISPKLYVIFAERNAVATPMGSTLRFAGTLELAGMSRAINQRRVNAIRKAARDYLNLPDDWGEETVWAGLRPVPPDGLPYIGRSQQVKNLTIATGHAMLGLSMGPITGKLTADIVLSTHPQLPLAAFDVNRFN